MTKLIKTKNARLPSGTFLAVFLWAVLGAWLVCTPAFARVLNIQTLTSPAGLSFWLVEDKSVPVITLEFAFATGAATDPYEKQGTTQLLSNMLDEGAGNMAATEFQNLLRDNAIFLSYSAGRDEFSGTLRSLKRHLPLAADLLSQSLTAPRFDEAPFARMKAANMTRIRASLSNPRWLAARLLNESMYQGHPYAANSGGTLESLELISPVDLRLARARHFATSRLHIGIAGDITPHAAGNLVDRVFSRLPIKASSPVVKPAPFPPVPDHTHFDLDIPQTNLSMAWPGIALNDRDYYPSVVLNYILGGGGFTSRLMSELRETRGLTYGAYSSPYRLKQAERFVIETSMLPQNVAPAVQAINDIINDLILTPQSQETLDAAKDYLIGSLPLTFTSTGSIARMLVSLQLDNRPSDTLDKYESSIRAVTQADIQRTAKRIFSAKPVIITVGARPDNMNFRTLTSIPNAEATAQ